MEAMPQIVFEFSKFKTSDNLIDWEAMSDNASPKYLQNNQQNHSVLSKDINDLLFPRALGMPNHTKLNQYDNTIAPIDV